MKILLLLLFIQTAWAAPAARLETDPELTAGYYEGDMLMDSQQRNGVRNESLRWPDRVVLYHINSNIDAAHRNHILLGLQILELNSCLRFKAADISRDTYYVNVTSEDGGCFSYVGFRDQVQQLNLQYYPLDTGCYRLGTIVHEFLHALGFYHQHSSSDRDDYVRIAKEYILDGKESNFNKYNETVVDEYDQIYDYGSVMQYTAYAFSKNGEMTIVPLKEGAEQQMGQRLQMSQSDIKKLNVMYKCPQRV
ncbi:seminal metalloprotease 1-like [Drosophila busckii]|uniref:seminal metalloprotease 1-like n=1 Tax=Drosophila busckii TaxID=30019 RepID=UPI001433155E|nr:seminal metalloprotease 1-like [Drosophila busckii]